MLTIFIYYVIQNYFIESFVYFKGKNREVEKNSFQFANS